MATDKSSGNRSLGATLRRADLRLYQTARSGYQWAKHERRSRLNLPLRRKFDRNSDVNLLQVHGGLLADPRVRRFYQLFGVLGSKHKSNGTIV